MLNVFEHQKFLLRRRSPGNPFGERIERSFRELMTLPDEDGIWFDYPIEYMNIAALNLCAALAQAVFEPRDMRELAVRLRSPMSDDEAGTGISSFRDVFTIDGPSGTRFMQGPEPAPDKKGRLNGSPLSELLLTVKKGDKTFLNRPDESWGVRLDQIPLLLFSRGTFYEKSAGRGYLTGTSGDLEIRTYPIDRGSLRRTIWMNVLARSQQKAFSGEYTEAGSGAGYDNWMWHTLSPEDVPEGQLSLRTGLFWMVANAYIEIADIKEPRRCIVTGEKVEGRIGISVVGGSTGRGYGVKVQREKGPEVRQSFFRHPNGPVRREVTKEDHVYSRHLSVDKTSGIIGHMAGLFFAAAPGGGSFKLAPVVEQIYELRLELLRSRERMPRLDLACFGFHMLSQKQNIHGGYEYELFHYPLLHDSGGDINETLQVAQELTEGYASDAREIERLLVSAIQRCMLVQTDTSQNEEGRLTFKPKKNLPPDELIPDAGRTYWIRVGTDLREFLGMLETSSAAAGELQKRRDEFEVWWRERSARHAMDLFESVFNDYSVSPPHIVASHKAKGYLYGTLRKAFGILSRRKDATIESIPS